MPRKKANEVEASTEETQPVEEETPEVPAEEAPVVEETEEAPEEVEETPEVPPEEVPMVEEAEETPVVVEAPEVAVKAPPVAPPSEVPVSSIPDGALFEYKGQIYRKRIIHRTQRVLADAMAKTRTIYTPIEDVAWLDLDTPVKRK